MNTKNLIISSILFLGIDYLYLSNMSKQYNLLIKRLTGNPIDFNYIYAITAYLFLILGINYFILDNLDKRNILLDAFVLGFVIYGTFDFTNLAIFKDYSLKLGIIDTIWGGILFTLITLVMKKINKN